MADTGEEVQELRFMVQHYKEEYGPQIQQLRDENVQLKAKIAYLQQKVDNQADLLKRLQSAGSPEASPSVTPPDTMPVSGSSTVSPPVTISTSPMPTHG